METSEFADVAEDFRSRVTRIVWCTVATVDTAGRPRTRILHPIWEGPVGWIATGRNTLKARHLAANANVALSYWDPQHDVVAVEGSAAWDDTAEAKLRIWDLFRSTPFPVGYDPGQFWPGGPADPTFGVLRIDARRITLSNLTDPPRVWVLARQ